MWILATDRKGLLVSDLQSSIDVYLTAGDIEVLPAEICNPSAKLSKMLCINFQHKLSADICKLSAKLSKMLHRGLQPL